jgi:hypothetical protein
LFTRQVLALCFSLSLAAASALFVLSGRLYLECSFLLNEWQSSCLISKKKLGSS